MRGWSTASCWRAFRPPRPTTWYRTSSSRPCASFAACGRHARDAALEALEVLDLIRHLPEAYREPLILRLVEGMTGPEIARQTGLTPDSVRVNLCRGMKMLRQLLEGTGAL